MPGSTSPECFGLKGREAIELARVAGKYGCDVLEIVELAPYFDVSHMSIKMAANMIYHYLGSRARTSDRSTQNRLKFCKKPKDLEDEPSEKLCPSVLAPRR